MIAAEHRRSDFAVFIQVMKIGARIIFADLARAFRIYGRKVGGVLRFFYRDGAVFRKKRAVAAVAGRKHAVEHIYAVCNRRQYVLGRTDSHNVAGFLAR